MKKIGTGAMGGTLLEIGAEDLRELRAIVHLQVIKAVEDLMNRLAVSVGLEPAVKPNEPSKTATAAAAPKTTKPRRTAAVQDRKPAASRPAGGYERVCEECGEAFHARRKDQTCCSKACRKRFDNHKRYREDKNAKAEKPFGQAQGKPFGGAQGRPFGGAQGRPGTRVAKCDTCKKPFEAKLFGPVAHHCPECRKVRNVEYRGKAAAPAIRPTVAPHRPAMPSDDAGKAARLANIRRLVALKEARELEADVIAGATEN
jgi:hypothetical protein